MSPNRKGMKEPHKKKYIYIYDDHCHFTTFNFLDLNLSPVLFFFVSILLFSRSLKWFEGTFRIASENVNLNMHFLWETSRLSPFWGIWFRSSIDIKVIVGWHNIFKSWGTDWCRQCWVSLKWWNTISFLSCGLKHLLCMC